MILILMVAAATQYAPAQDESGTFEQAMTTQRCWRIEAQPLVWFASLSGESTFKGSAATLMDVDSLLGLDDSEPSFLGSALLTYDTDDHGRWLMWLEGFDFSTESSGAIAQDFGVLDSAVSAGTVVHNDFGLSNIGLKAGWDPFGNVLHDDDYELRFALLAGTRMIGLDQRLEAEGGPTVSYDGSSLGLEGGVRVRIARSEDYTTAGHWSVDLALTLGAGGGSDATVSYFDIWAGAEYLVTDNMGLRIGYRQLDVNLEDDSATGGPYEFDGRLAGLYVGGTITF
ncbi:MAG: hypothetical protein D8M59_12580 [Planctomycetes bacterium]|nr:hypothetical protein [Planctomycetota bacterium]